MANIKVYHSQTTLETPFGPLQLRMAGKSTAKPVLLMHGAMNDECQLSWYHLVPFLAPYYRVIGLDFPCHGGSRPWKGKATESELLECIESVRYFLHVDKLNLIGFSMGGAVAIAYALKHMLRVRSFVAVSPGGVSKNIPSQFYSWVLSRISGAGKYLAKTYQHISREKVSRSFSTSLLSGENSEAFEDLLELTHQEMVAKSQHGESVLDDWQVQTLSPFRLRINHTKKLRNLTMPTLWLSGAKDQLVPPEDVQKAAALTPRSKFELIPNAGHFLPLDQPEKVNQSILAFLQSLEKPVRTAQALS